MRAVLQPVVAPLSAAAGSVWKWWTHQPAAAGTCRCLDSELSAWDAAEQEGLDLEATPRKSKKKSRRPAPISPPTSPPHATAASDMPSSPVVAPMYTPQPPMTPQPRMTPTPMTPMSPIEMSRDDPDTLGGDLDVWDEHESILADLPEGFEPVQFNDAALNEMLTLQSPIVSPRAQHTPNENANRPNNHTLPQKPPQAYKAFV